MSTTETVEQVLPARPKRADARRNYEKILAAAREAFAEGGTSTSLEEIARRADVGIGTLYRHFPSRQALLEAIYFDEVNALCRSVPEFAELAPWDALVGWLRRFVGYLATKQALAHELMEYLEPGAPLFQTCRTSLFAAGQPLLDRAQQAGVVRPDATLAQVIQMVMGIAKIPNTDPEQTDHILQIALDGLRYRAPNI